MAHFMDLPTELHLHILQFLWVGAVPCTHLVACTPTDDLPLANKGNVVALSSVNRAMRSLLLPMIFRVLSFAVKRQVEFWDVGEDQSESMIAEYTKSLRHLRYRIDNIIARDHLQRYVHAIELSQWKSSFFIGQDIPEEPQVPLRNVIGWELEAAFVSLQDLVLSLPSLHTLVAEGCLLQPAFMQIMCSSQSLRMLSFGLCKEINEYTAPMVFPETPPAGRVSIIMNALSQRDSPKRPNASQKGRRMENMLHRAMSSMISLMPGAGTPRAEKRILFASEVTSDLSALRALYIRGNLGLGSWQGVVDFLCDHPHLEELTFTAVDRHLRQPIDHNWDLFSPLRGSAHLPHLHTFSGGLSVLPRLIPGRPVEEITLSIYHDNHDPDMLSELLATVGLSTANFVDLRLNFEMVWPAQDPFQPALVADIVAALPAKLRVLEWKAFANAAMGLTNRKLQMRAKELRQIFMQQLERWTHLEWIMVAIDPMVAPHGLHPVVIGSSDLTLRGHSTLFSVRILDEGVWDWTDEPHLDSARWQYS